MSDWGFWEVVSAGVILILTYSCGPLVGVILLILLGWGLVTIADWVKDRKRRRWR